MLLGVRSGTPGRPSAACLASGPVCAAWLRNLVSKGGRHSGSFGHPASGSLLLPRTGGACRIRDWTVRPLG